MGSSSEPFRLFHIPSECEGKTLASVLKLLFPEESWGNAKGLISSRHVQVNGNLCLDHGRKITSRDVIKVWRESLPKPIEAKDIRIVFADDFLVVIEKPPGITSVRHFEERNLSSKRRQVQPTLDELLPEALDRFLKNRQTQGERLPRSSAQSRFHDKADRKLPKVFAVHRLDRDTSGLMLFARTQQIGELLGKMFRRHSIDRRYWAVAYGKVESQTIESNIVRDIGGGRRGSSDNPDDPTAQHAITHVKTLETLGDYSIVECRLETGRTHQIRIHLSEVGHRLCGEPLYNKDQEGKVLEDSSGAPRQALHSASLRFKHPITGEVQEFKSPWPTDLYRWLRKLGKSST
ncbi:MAG: RluA family pseudouridine synthase [Pirellulales bacterium]